MMCPQNRTESSTAAQLPTEAEQKATCATAASTPRLSHCSRATAADSCSRRASARPRRTSAKAPAFPPFSLLLTARSLTFSLTGSHNRFKLFHQTAATLPRPARNSYRASGVCAEVQAPLQTARFVAASQRVSTSTSLPELLWIQGMMVYAHFSRMLQTDSISLQQAVGRLRLPWCNERRPASAWSRYPSFVRLRKPEEPHLGPSSKCCAAILFLSSTLAEGSTWT